MLVIGYCATRTDLKLTPDFTACYYECTLNTLTHQLLAHYLQLVHTCAQLVTQTHYCTYKLLAHYTKLYCAHKSLLKHYLMQRSLGEEGEGEVGDRQMQGRKWRVRRIQFLVSDVIFH